MTERYGAVFRRPRPGGPAAKAGIAAYDVVTAVNGASLADWRDFATMISAKAPGTVVSLTTYRNRQLIEVRVETRLDRICMPTEGALIAVVEAGTRTRLTARNSVSA